MSGPSGSTPEDQRLQALARYEILDALPGEPFDRLTSLVADALDVPVVMINFVGEFRQWGKSCVGLHSSDMSRDESFCTWTIQHERGMVVQDARLDPRFAAHPMVTGEPHFVMYAGTPLTTPDGHRIGTLCVTDRVSRPFTDRETRVLRGFATLIEDALEVRLRELQLQREVDARAAEAQRAARHTDTLTAVTALFDSGLEPVEATVAAAQLVGSAADVDWFGLFRLQDGQLDILTTWNGPHEGRPSRLGRRFMRDSLAGFAAEQQLSVFVDDYPSYPGALSHLVHLGVTSVAVLALGDIRGARYLLGAAHLGEHRPWQDGDRTLLEAAARSVQGALERHDRLRSAQAAAHLDDLTGLPNRRALNAALQRAETNGRGFDLVVIDLDGMKTVNDAHGHERGDALLRVFAQALQGQFRPDDGVFRLGGDEFAVVLCGLHPRLPENDVLARIDRAVTAVQDHGFPRVGASSGVARSGGRPPMAVLAEADQVMYTRKRRRGPADAPIPEHPTPA